MDVLLSAVPSREGHFRLESGYHTNLWLTLDGLFMETANITPVVEALAVRLRPYRASAVCGPFVGGAFLAQLLAVALNVRFFYTQPAPARQAHDLFSAEYYLGVSLDTP
ncbi:MAG: hypothetical protein LC791_19535 [Acidobacteria bacterium]|nr:hypothetical protein [Acidobacteriota bacterium]